MNKKSKSRSRFLLVLFPIAIVLILLAVEILMRHHILFTSLVSSIFLIYLKPDDPMNDTLTIIVSQGLATVVGYTSFLLWVIPTGPAASR